MATPIVKLVQVQPTMQYDGTNAQEIADAITGSNGLTLMAEGGGAATIGWDSAGLLEDNTIHVGDYVAVGPITGSPAVRVVSGADLPETLAYLSDLVD